MQQEAQNNGLSLLRALALLTGLAWASAALAQGGASPPVSRAACLVKPTEPLKYPEDEDKLRMDGSVKAQLSFSRPDRAPGVEVLSWSGSRGMFEAAKIYLLDYRLPCLAHGEQVVLEQEVVFKAIHMDVRQNEVTSNPWDCLRTPGPFSLHETQQTGTQIRQRTRGNVLLEMTFEAPDTPPKVKKLYNSGPHQFLLEVMAHVDQYRLPCMKPGQDAATMQQTFAYAGSARGNDYSLRDMDFLPFLGAIKDVAKVPVNFDLDTMSCPFKLRWAMYQPAHANQVTEIGPKVPQRRPLLDWMETLTMRLSKEQFEIFFGAQMIVTVPCGKINL